MSQTQPTGQDSFLDIVANLVGIMIILLVIVGAHATHASQDAADTLEADDPTEAEFADLNQAIATAENSVAKLRQDNSDLYDQIEQENKISAEMTTRRHQMLMEVELLKQATEEKKAQLTQRLATWEAKDREEQVKRVAFEEKKRLLQRELSDVKRATQAVAATLAQPPRDTIEHHPNPIARTVFTNEVHFRIADGKISYVPMDELIASMKSEWKLKAEKLVSAANTIETVGPREGYRLQYQLGLQTVTERTELGPVQRNVIQFQRFVILPQPDLVAEPVAKALDAGSQFQQRLGAFEPAETTVSIWVYPDGFSDHQQLKNWLYKSGYQVASWPLMPGRPISGGPDGLKTSAQ